MQHHYEYSTYNSHHKILVYLPASNMSWKVEDWISLLTAVRLCSPSSRLYSCIYNSSHCEKLNCPWWTGWVDRWLSCIAIRHVTASRPLLVAWVNVLSGANWWCKCHCYYFARGSDCEVLWWVCLSVCVSVCLSALISPEPYARSLPNFYACCLCPWLGPPPACWR